MNQRRIDLLNKLTENKDKNPLDKYRRDKRKRVHKRIDYYNEILRRLEEEKRAEEIDEIINPYHVDS